MLALDEHGILCNPHVISKLLADVSYAMFLNVTNLVTPAATTLCVKLALS